MFLKRPMTARDHFDMDSRAMIQLTLQVASQEVIPKIVDYFNQTVIGLHLKQEGENLVVHNDKLPIFQIPNTYRTKTLQGVATYVGQNCCLPFSQSLASISVGEKVVVLNIVHSISDGGYFKLLVHGFLNGIYPFKNQLAPFPVTSPELYPKEIARAPSGLFGWGKGPDVIRIRTKDPNGIRQGHGFGPQYYTIKTPANRLKCYNHKSHKVSNFTETLWLSQILASSCHKSRLLEKAGIITCVDLRQWIENPKQIDPFSVCNSFATVTPVSHIRPGMTLRELGRQMRLDLHRRLDNFEQFSFAKAFENENQDGTDANDESQDPVLEITSMGTLHLKPPIVDAYTSFTVQPVHANRVVSLMSFGVKSRNIDDVIIRLRYGPNQFSTHEMNLYGKTIDYFMHNVDLDLTVNDAFQELLSFQKQLE